MSNGEKRGHDTAWDPLHHMDDSVCICSIHCTFTGQTEKTSQIDCFPPFSWPNSPKRTKPAAFCVWSTHNRQRFTHTKLSLPNVAFSGKRPCEPKTTAGDLSCVPFHPIFCFSSGKKTNLQKSRVSLIVSPCLSYDLQDLYHRWICIGCHQGFVLFKGRRARRPLQRSSLWLIAPDDGLHCLAMFGSLENSKLDKNRLKRAAT